jgi:poly-gamma-glutamate capsule biosynthesis protein CapA/YwtB (metallophosphatase superfamily)
MKASSRAVGRSHSRAGFSRLQGDLFGLPRASRCSQALVLGILGFLSATALAEVPTEDTTASGVADGFTLALAGDVAAGSPMLPLIQQRSPQLIALLHAVDLAFGNFENTAIDWSRYTGSPQAQSGGDWFLASAAVPRDLQELGFGLFSHANNHGTDWGVDGLLLTDKLLDEAGLVHAGSGTSERAARAPAFVSTAKARVALVATASTFLPESRAGDPRGLVPARPGISVLHVTQTILVSPARLQELADLRDAISRREGEPVKTDRKKVELLEDLEPQFQASNDVGNGVDIRYDIDEADRQALLRSVRQAHRTADLTLLSVHWHEPGNYLETPADFAISMAHAAVENGADVVVGHGPHLLRGIEIYLGRPIFYSLGNFAMMLKTMQPLPRDEFRDTKLDADTSLDIEPLEYNRKRWSSEAFRYDSVLPVLRYSAGRVVEIRLYPLVLGYKDLGISQGVPRLAKGTDAQRILLKLQTLSQPYGTRIGIQGDLGVISLLPPPSPARSHP